MEDPALQGWPLQFTRYRSMRIICPRRQADAIILAASWTTAYTNWTTWSVVDCSLQPAGLIACQMDCLACMSEERAVEPIFTRNLTADR